MRTAFVLLTLAVSAVGYAAEVPLGCQQSVIAPKYQPPVQDLSGALPAPDYLDTVTACNTHDKFGTQPPERPKSAWLETERRIYADALARTHADIVVVPFQIQGYGLDRIERALMTADLAYSLGEAGAAKVADPFLVSLALGEGTRRIDAIEAEQLARRMGAKKIVFAYVGHDTHHAFTLTLHAQDLARAAAAVTSARWQRDWRGLAFTNEKTPALVFHDLLPEVLKTLPLGLRAKNGSGAAAPAQNPSRIATTPREFLTSTQKPLSAAATFNLLGALAPPGEERTRQRMFERALLVALRSKGTTPNDAFLEVYALMGLERRPSALARIGKLDTAPFNALRALLDGNLPLAQSATAAVADPFQQLLLQTEVRDLEFRYGQDTLTDPTAAKRIFGAGRAEWLNILAFRSNDLDLWSVDRLGSAFFAASHARSIKRSNGSAGPIARGPTPTIGQCFPNSSTRRLVNGCIATRTTSGSARCLSSG